MTPPLKYTVVHPDKMRFIPLGDEKEMSLREIVEHHPKGVEFGHIVTEYEQWPILLDSQNKVLSFPPIINSHDLGKLTPDVKDIFVEVTGTVYQTVLNALTIVTLSLADRGGRIFSTDIHYPYGSKRRVTTPELAMRNISIDMDDVHRILGLEIAIEDTLNLLERARYHVKRIDDNLIEITIPCYRMDIMHSLDIIEDIAIMYGYNNIKPRWPRQITFGKLSAIEVFSDLVREIMVGLEFQEILSFALTNEEQLFTKMNLAKAQEIVELLNPTSSRFTLIRNWLTPSLMEFLSKNTHAEYPQKIFEVGDCACLDRSYRTGVRETRTAAGLIAHSNSCFSEIKAILDALALNIGFTYKLEDCIHNSFIDGRVGHILVEDKIVGVIGEVTPLVLELWGLAIPVVGLEIQLAPLMKVMR
jgi:phenylalanyl-tRNA synthetase beta chain